MIEGHMRKKKVPPISTVNGLQLTETDQMIKDQQLKLTVLEGALIAKTNFQSQDGLH